MQAPFRPKITHKVNCSPEVGMAKYTYIILLLLLVPIFAGAQTAPTMTEINFSNAEVSQAGPDSFYIRNVVLTDQTVSITVALGDTGLWEIKEVVPENTNVLPTGLILLRIQ